MGSTRKESGAVYVAILNMFVAIAYFLVGNFKEYILVGYLILNSVLVFAAANDIEKIKLGKH